jgi:quercetin dioxygenase-like cupin family protein
VRLPQSGVETPAYFFESLGYMVPDRHMDPYFAEFVPLEAGQEPRAHMHTGFEFLYVLDGELGLRHGTEDCVLETGDAVYFDASTKHAYHCAGKKPAQAIIVTMHQPPPAQSIGMRPAAAAPAPRTPADPPTPAGIDEKRPA